MQIVYGEPYHFQTNQQHGSMCSLGVNENRPPINNAVARTLSAEQA